MQADVERLLARLLTDEVLRQRFLADPLGIAQAEGLSAEEARAFARMPAQDLQTAARSYDHKRASSARSTLSQRIVGWFRNSRR